MLIGLTGPSSFSTDLMRMLERYFHANFVLLYHDLEENLNYWLDRVDGVVMAGGVDIHPTVYGVDIMNGCNLTKFDLNRDIRELHILHRAQEKKIPTLAICRGHQMMGIYQGMKLLPDISSSMTGHNPTRTQVTLAKNEPMHSVKLLHPEKYREEYEMPENPAERAIIAKVKKQPSDRIWVNSFHHQGIEYEAKRDLPAGVRVMGLGRIDIGKIEYIVEFMDGPNWVSVQWHPEYDWEENSYSRSILAKFKGMLEKK